MIKIKINNHKNCHRQVRMSNKLICCLGYFGTCGVAGFVYRFHDTYKNTNNKRGKTIYSFGHGLRGIPQGMVCGIFFPCLAVVQLIKFELPPNIKKVHDYYKIETNE